MPDDAKHRGDLPDFARHHPALWREPWKVSPDPAQHADFKAELWAHGYLSPHFTRREGASHDGVAIPDNLAHNAQRHAFTLERVRHELGRPLGFVDMYRSAAHNRAVGGATNSEHLYADASDWGAQHDQAEFNRVMTLAFAAGGIGTGASSGHVAHVDNGVANGGPRRWTYPGV